jgi:hypothetical protein
MRRVPGWYLWHLTRGSPQTDFDNNPCTPVMECYKHLMRITYRFWSIATPTGTETIRATDLDAALDVAFPGSRARFQAYAMSADESAQIGLIVGRHGRVLARDVQVSDRAA